MDYPRYVAAMTRVNERRFWMLLLAPLLLISVTAAVLLYLVTSVAWWAAGAVGVGLFNILFMSVYLGGVERAIRRRARREAERDWSRAHILYLLYSPPRGQAQ